MEKSLYIVARDRFGVYEYKTEEEAIDKAKEIINICIAEGYLDKQVYICKTIKSIEVGTAPIKITEMKWATLCVI